MRKTSTQEILAFIDAARRLPDNDKKEIYVKFLVKQYELRCNATVIKANNKESFNEDDK
jgi:hypothetical protein